MGGRPKRGTPEILYVFERGAPHEEEANAFLREIDRYPDLIRRYRYKEHVFLGKRNTLPLHASDLLAYETRRQLLSLATDDLVPNQILYRLVDTTDRLLIMDKNRLMGILLETVKHYHPEAYEQTFGTSENPFASIL
jgi:hypothetical protein